MADGTFSEQALQYQIHYPAVGWVSEPAVYYAGEDNINACLLGVNQSDGIILAFRGTLPPTNFDVPPQVLDWLQNFEADPIDAPASFPAGVQLHEGFWNSVATLWPQIVPALKAIQAANPNAKLYVTGHSKGGGMAAIAAARLIFEEQITAAGVYLYAPPRAGNSTFVSTFPLSVPVQRYEHYLDVVPFVPPNFPHLSIFSKIPFLSKLFPQVKSWDYTPLGTLNYIRQDGTIVPDSPGLARERETEIENALKFDAADIAKAHGPWCECTFSDGGYMKGVSPTGLCP
jgi:hypothetical protein